MAMVNWQAFNFVQSCGPFGGCGEGAIRVASGKDFWPFNVAVIDRRAWKRFLIYVIVSGNVIITGNVA